MSHLNAKEQTLRQNDIFLQDVLNGLSSQPKTLPCKYFYDEVGSSYFYQICQTPEYYLTRTELALMTNEIHSIVGAMGDQALIIEFGSGVSEKIRILLNALTQPAGYIPIDISESYLEDSVRILRDEYPGLFIHGVNADFTHPFELPKFDVDHKRKIIYFPGSTIGNFNDSEALQLMQVMRSLLGMGDGLLIGIDLKKDESILNQAYNDAQGITARFNKNILVRIRNELNIEVDEDQFEHVAFYNSSKGRIEMHLRSLGVQEIKIKDQVIQIESGETIHTESSYKYSIDHFYSLAEQAGFAPYAAWTDECDYFAVLHVRCI